MTLSMYSSLVPPLVSSLVNLRHLLAQAEGHAEAHGYDATVLLDGCSIAEVGKLRVLEPLLEYWLAIGVINPIAMQRSIA
jgi:hypothetical protein